LVYRDGRHPSNPACERRYAGDCLWILTVRVLAGLCCLFLTSTVLTAQSTADAVSPANIQQEPPALGSDASAAATAPLPPTSSATERAALNSFAGRQVTAVRFEGVEDSMLAPLQAQLPLQPGQTLDTEKVRDSLRRLFATGLYRTIDVVGVPNANGVDVVFVGTKKMFIGRISIDGVNSDNLLAQLNGSTKLNPGTVYTETKLLETDALLKQALEDNGYYEGLITRVLDADQLNGLVNVHYTIQPGTLARIGEITVDGDSGLSLKQFRKKGKLRHNARVGRNTVSTTLSSLQKVYQKKERLAASITLTAKSYKAQGQYLNYEFTAKQGPLVKITVSGAKLSKGEIERMVPIYEEGTVDLDLINEGAHNIRNYLQGQGYFDATVTPRPVHRAAGEIDLQYVAETGVHHRVDSVTITGNKYFDDQTIREHVSVYKANIADRNGGYSQAMVAADVSNITALYEGNGFSSVKVTPEVKSVKNKDKPKQNGLLSIEYHIVEGEQQKIGKYDIVGAKTVTLDTLRPMLNTQVGQPYSSLNVVGDRDLILNYYLSHGYDKAQVNLFQQTDPKNPGLVDVTLKINEGQQFFVRQLLISGERFTKPSTTAQQITIEQNQPLDESALLTTQRKLYNLALFNQVNAAIQNPNGEQIKKNVLLQLTEAKRWDVTYGFGFQAQTGTPSTNCPNTATLLLLGINPSSYNCSANGHVGASPEVLLNISRINLFGTQQSLTLNTAYGTLEQIATLTYNNPDLLHNPKFNFSLSGGYTSSQNVTTYQAAVLGVSLRVSHRLSKPTTLLYSFAYRDVKPSSVQVSIAEIPLLSQPARVAGPGLTWLRDTRDNPLDARRGTFNTASTFFSSSVFGSQANFVRIDASNATYYPFGNGWLFARQTRYGIERSYGKPSQELIPLPERLYAGGAQSLRGFSFNAAGPRDPATGYPTGGAGAFVNTFELRTPSPHLPYVGNALGFVLFHDMGNVFDRASQIWPSFTRLNQPTPAACRNLTAGNTTAGPNDAVGQQGGCSFAYFTHDVGLGLRYHTPIGPVRIDVSYNLNPPVYPVLYDYNSTSTDTIPAHVGIASNFNFFFSIGQMF
jgi:outer membrane protein insertion porin family